MSLIVPVSQLMSIKYLEPWPKSLIRELPHTNPVWVDPDEACQLDLYQQCKKWLQRKPWTWHAIGPGIKIHGLKFTHFQLFNSTGLPQLVRRTSSAMEISQRQLIPDPERLRPRWRNADSSSPKILLDPVNPKFRANK